jgi:RNA polymerase sigma-54 factor
LRTLHPDTPGLRLALAIADKHLDKLADRELTLLRRELAASDEELAQAVALVRGLHPRPGATVSSAKAEYVVPDVFVRRTDRGWTVEVNSSTLPRVRLNQSYADMLAKAAFIGARSSGSAVAAQEPGNPQRNPHEGCT